MAKSKTQFIKFMGGSHFNNMNVSLYLNTGGAALRAENIINNKSVGAKQFGSAVDAVGWYESLPGSGAGRLTNAIDELDFGR